MIDHFTFDDAYLKIGQHKSLHMHRVELEVAVYEDDPYADAVDDPAQYIDGVRISGEFSFDTSPIHYQDKHPVKPNVTGELTLNSEGESSKFTILVLEKTNEIDHSTFTDLEKRQLRRYYWSFFGIGKPAWDKIGLFPTDYTGKKSTAQPQKVFTCTDFRGFHPLEVSSLIVAPNQKQARESLIAELKRRGLYDSDVEFTLSEVNIYHPGAIILHDGEDE
jgi:hypothetical protein